MVASFGILCGIIALCAFAGLMRTALQLSALSLRTRNWVGKRLHCRVRARFAVAWKSFDLQ